MKGIESEKVVICLEDRKIKGTIYNPRGRLTDFINDPQKQFIPVTHPTIYSLDEKEKLIERLKFLKLNKNFIVSIFSEADIITK